MAYVWQYWSESAWQDSGEAVGADAVFTLTATGTDPITVNWQQLFEEWQSAGTGDSLTVATQDSRQSVYRSVIVSPWGADISGIPG